jgi:hypothetical protein
MNMRYYNIGSAEAPKENPAGLSARGAGINTLRTGHTTRPKTMLTMEIRMSYMSATPANEMT